MVKYLKSYFFQSNHLGAYIFMKIRFPPLWKLLFSFSTRNVVRNIKQIDISEKMSYSKAIEPFIQKYPSWVYFTGVGGRMLKENNWNTGIKKNIPKHYKVHNHIPDEFWRVRGKGDLIWIWSLVETSCPNSLQTTRICSSPKKWKKRHG